MRAVPELAPTRPRCRRSSPAWATWARSPPSRCTATCTWAGPCAPRWAGRSSIRGEPAKTLAERLLPDSPWRDVAGQPALLDYAPRVVARSRAAEPRPRGRAARRARRAVVAAPRGRLRRGLPAGPLDETAPPPARGPTSPTRGLRDRLRAPEPTTWVTIPLTGIVPDQLLIVPARDVPAQPATRSRLAPRAPLGDRRLITKQHSDPRHVLGAHPYAGGGAVRPSSARLHVIIRWHDARSRD